MEAPPGEAPLAVDAHIVVPVLQHAHLPLIGGGLFEFVVAVDDAVRVIGVIEVDDVVADEVHRGPGPSQDLREPRLDRVAPASVTAYAHVRREQSRE